MKSQLLKHSQFPSNHPKALVKDGNRDFMGRWWQSVGDCWRASQIACNPTRHLLLKWYQAKSRLRSRYLVKFLYLDLKAFHSSASHLTVHSQMQARCISQANSFPHALETSYILLHTPGRLVPSPSPQDLHRNRNTHNPREVMRQEEDLLDSWENSLPFIFWCLARIPSSFGQCLKTQVLRKLTSPLSYTIVVILSEK